MTGIEVLKERDFAPLKGKRIGLITNFTAVLPDYTRTLDVLARAPGVTVAAIFTPEHGLTATLAQRDIASAKDEATGIPVYSLYRAGQYRPDPEMMKGIDALVYDIQDVGARFYTYITTLGYMVEEAAKYKVPIYVLDRPNPIGGMAVEGPALDEQYVSFVGFLPGMPIRPGLTVGELARLYNGEKKLGADVRVIRMKNWRRSQYMDQTGVVWVNPSPQIRSLVQAILYPGVCLLESRIVWVKTGWDLPFQAIGAPWVKGRETASYLNGRGIRGVSFIARKFTPDAGAFKDQECEGIEILLLDRNAVKPVALGVELVSAVMKFHPGRFNPDVVARLIGNEDTIRRIKAGEDPREIAAAWATGERNFRDVRAKYLLYPERTFDATVALRDARPRPAAKLVEATRGQERQFAEAFAEVEKRIGQKAFPGAVLAIGRHGRLVALKAFGRMDYSGSARAMPRDAIFDLASVSKVVGATTAGAILYERRQLDLDAPVVKYVPEFAGAAGHEQVLVRHLLGHSSGLHAQRALWKEANDRPGIMKLLLSMPLESKPGEVSQYRDYNMMLLGEVVQRIAGNPLDRFLAQNAFGPLGMKQTAYNPPPKWIRRIPPTEQDDVLRHRLVRGLAHDENAFLMGGVAGHAGLFSSARDLAVFAQMYLNGGSYNGKRILSEETVRSFMQRQSSPSGTTRALGWDTPADGSFAGDLASPRAIMHTGYTGTSIYIDPDRDAFVILLTNRVHPTRNNGLIFEARPAIHTAVLSGLDRLP